MYVCMYGTHGTSPLQLLRTWGPSVFGPSNFCDWLSFPLASALFNGWQMYIVDRVTKFKPTVAKNMSGEDASGQSGGLIALMDTFEAANENREDWQTNRQTTYRNY